MNRQREATWHTSFTNRVTRGEEPKEVRRCAARQHPFSPWRTRSEHRDAWGGAGRPGKLHKYPSNKSYIQHMRHLNKPSITKKCSLKPKHVTVNLNSPLHEESKWRKVKVRKTIASKRLSSTGPALKDFFPTLCTDCEHTNHKMKKNEWFNL
jgi:hypothetical protein